MTTGCGALTNAGFAIPVAEAGTVEGFVGFFALGFAAAVFGAGAAFVAFAVVALAAAGFFAAAFWVAGLFAGVFFVLVVIPVLFSLARLRAFVSWLETNYNEDGNNARNRYTTAHLSAPLHNQACPLDYIYLTEV